jgi:hypothetical protein
MAPIKILASQAHSVNQYKKLRTKVMKCCANIYFNRGCLNKKVIPKYANIKEIISTTMPIYIYALTKFVNILGSQNCALLLDLP